MPKERDRDRVLLTAAEACRLLRCGPAVLHRLRETARIKGIKHEGSTRWLIFADSIDAYLRGLGMREEYVRPAGSRRRAAEEAHRRSMAALASCGMLPRRGLASRGAGASGHTSSSRPAATIRLAIGPAVELDAPAAAADEDGANGR